MTKCKTVSNSDFERVFKTMCEYIDNRLNRYHPTVNNQTLRDFAEIFYQQGFNKGFSSGHTEGLDFAKDLAKSSRKVIVVSERG